jgi:acetylornithine/succinyldiaminopimelate/putrescine aminotransferase
MMKQHEYLQVEEKYGAHNYKPLDVIITRGEDVWVWDVNGNKYLDCLAAYSAVNQGHCHPKILQPLIDQAQMSTLTSRAFRNDQLALFYEELSELTNSNKVLPMNSGAEAVETAIKVVRKWGYTIKGVPVLVVSKRLGHAKPSITLDVYGHLISSMQEQAAEVMDQFITPLEIPSTVPYAQDKLTSFL